MLGSARGRSSRLEPIMSARGGADAAEITADDQAGPPSFAVPPPPKSTGKRKVATVQWPPPPPPAEVVAAESGGGGSSNCVGRANVSPNIRTRRKRMSEESREERRQRKAAAAAAACERREQAAAAAEEAERKAMVGLLRQYDEEAARPTSPESELCRLAEEATDPYLSRELRARLRAADRLRRRVAVGHARDHVDGHARPDGAVVLVTVPPSTQ